MPFKASRYFIAASWRLQQRRGNFLTTRKAVSSDYDEPILGDEIELELGFSQGTLTDARGKSLGNHPSSAELKAASIFTKANSLDHRSRRVPTELLLQAANDRVAKPG
jgi:hypothetical protein